MTNLNLRSYFISFMIGDYDFGEFPLQYIESFRFDRTFLAGTEFSINLFDQTAMEVGRIIAEGKTDIQFSYGYYPDKISPTYKGLIMDYTANMREGGATLEIRGITTGYTDAHTVVHHRSYAAGSKRGIGGDFDYGMPVHEIIEDIAEEFGWTLGEIEPTVPIKKKTALELADEVSEIICNTGETAMQFIYNELIPKAISANTGEGDYYFDLVHIRGENVVYFQPCNFRKPPEHEFIFEWNTPHSEIIEFTPTYSGLVQTFFEGGEINVPSLSEDANDFINERYNQDSNPDRSLSGERIFDGTPYKRILSFSSGSEDEFKKELASSLGHTFAQVYTGSMVIAGNPDMKTYENISVIVLTHKGEIHHTTGVYRIMGIEDTMEEGDFRTTLQLMRISLRVGEKEAVGDDQTSYDYNVEGMLPE